MYRLHNCDIFPTLKPLCSHLCQLIEGSVRRSQRRRSFSGNIPCSSGPRPAPAGTVEKRAPVVTFFFQLLFRQLRIKQIAGLTHVHPELTTQMQMRTEKKELSFQCQFSPNAEPLKNSSSVLC
ncbi:hypothetical protein CEXT_118251 [Caerostris extrusa]|uniref:Uncharacterized protein n=1 Tax=Caerostris extrusa TaxID=172846 RepID=A0AAV4XZV3_CAEEX|nr:hypothetical protein CEXT_118251 [Caerostris extrusa]